MLPATLRLFFQNILKKIFQILRSQVSFSNLLDNALESCKQYREHHPQNDSLFIHLSTDYKTKMFMIQMKNSKDPDIPFTRQSTKDDSSLHGHGLSIIESIGQGLWRNLSVEC